MTQEVKPQDHPDFIGGWVWTELESRWIEERIAEAILAEREACIEACRKTITSQRSAWGANFCIEAIRTRGQA